MSYEWIISGTIILGLVLGVWAKIGGQTVPELLRDLTDYFMEVKEDNIESAVEL